MDALRRNTGAKLQGYTLGTFVTRSAVEMGIAMCETDEGWPLPKILDTRARQNCSKTVWTCAVAAN